MKYHKKKKSIDVCMLGATKERRVKRVQSNPSACPPPLWSRVWRKKMGGCQPVLRETEREIGHLFSEGSEAGLELLVLLLAYLINGRLLRTAAEGPTGHVQLLLRLEANLVHHFTDL